MVQNVSILVTGSREFVDEARMRRALHHYGDFIVRNGGHPVVHHGAARGADSLAAAIAADLGYTVVAHPADWSSGRNAGFVRNIKMVALQPEIVLAFKDNLDRSLRHGGTEHCIRQAITAGLITRLVTPNGFVPIRLG